MIGLFEIDDDPELAKAQIAWLVEGVARTNRMLMIEHHVPPIYQSGVGYRPEPWNGYAQSFSDVREVVRRRWGECKSLTAWLLASHRNAARDENMAARFGVDVSYRDYPPGQRPRGFKLQPDANGWQRLFHVQVRLPDGSLEDPTLKVPLWRI